jgi:branched-chain amino acid transport system permease protein
MTSWQKSGELMAMMILGGMGSLLRRRSSGAAVSPGPGAGRCPLTEHWMLILGPILVLVVLFGQRGLAQLLGAQAP